MWSVCVLLNLGRWHPASRAFLTHKQVEDLLAVLSPQESLGPKWASNSLPPHNQQGSSYCLFLLKCKYIQVKMEAFVSYHSSDKPRQEVSPWARVNDDRMKVSPGRQPGVRLRPWLMDTAVYPKHCVSFLETGSQRPTPDLLGWSYMSQTRYAHAGSRTEGSLHLGLMLRDPGQVTFPPLWLLFLT